MAVKTVTEGSTVLVTGGTGSFGSTMVRRLLESDVAEVRVFSRDELKQDDMRRALDDPRVRFYIGDVRDYDSVDRATRGVDFVFHAAALKQVPSCEFFPMEAVRTNVLGSSNVIEAATRTACRAVVCLGTDKAVYPVNAMGMSKALMEKTAQAFARNNPTARTVVSTVRYGNVMCLARLGHPAVRRAGPRRTAADRDRPRHDPVPHVLGRGRPPRRARFPACAARRPVRPEGSGLHGW